MDVLQVSLMCFLLMMNFDPVPAQVSCTGCSQGYFVKVNCTTNQGSISGVQCRPCTNCSAANLETLSECSTYADSVCVSKRAPVVTSPKPATESPPDETVIVAVGVFLVVFVLLLGSALTLLQCRGRCYNKVKGNLLLQSHAKLLPQQDKPVPSHNSLYKSGSTVTEVAII